MAVDLTDRDQALLTGEGTAAERLAMKVVVAVADAMGAGRLLDITGAHIDSCLFHGRAGLDFAERLVAGGGQVAVPATLNVGALDLLHPELYRGDPETATLARRQMAAYEAMGCRPTWTCAPYQLPTRPALGDHVAWGESNAIVFANSVLGARTHRYGDFTDIAAALVGRAPAAGLHLDERRRGQVVFRTAALPGALLGRDVAYPVLGALVGERTGQRVPVITGLPPDTGEDRLKALGAAAASAGTVGMFHAVGITPEAPTLDAVLRDRLPEEVVEVTPAMMAEARDALSTVAGGALRAVSVGTPHYSARELATLAGLLDGRRVRTELFVSTGRDVLAALPAVAAALEDAGARLVTDTCTYLAPLLGPARGPVMTDSAKWAWYAPGNIGVDVVFGSVEECVESAVAGEVRRDDGLWAGG